MIIKRNTVKELLENQDYQQLAVMARANHQKTLKYIQMDLYHQMDQPLRWYAIESLGFLAKTFAKEERKIYLLMLGRFVWTMNEEGGNVPWSATESMASIIANQPEMFGDEYTPLLITNGLENPICHRGVLWSAGHISQVKPSLVAPFTQELLPFLSDPDKDLCGYAAWAFGHLGDKSAIELISKLTTREETVYMFNQGKLEQKTVGQLASEAIARLSQVAG